MWPHLQTATAFQGTQWSLLTFGPQRQTSHQWHGARHTLWASHGCLHLWVVGQYEDVIGQWPLSSWDYSLHYQAHCLHLNPSLWAASSSDSQCCGWCRSSCDRLQREIESNSYGNKTFIYVYYIYMCILQYTKWLIYLSFWSKLRENLCLPFWQGACCTSFCRRRSVGPPSTIWRDKGRCLSWLAAQLRNNNALSDRLKK